MLSKELIQGLCVWDCVFATAGFMILLHTAVSTTTLVGFYINIVENQGPVQGAYTNFCRDLLLKGCSKLESSMCLRYCGRPFSAHLK